MILNMYMGHSFLEKEFGVKPKIGWMVDAFGHSVANAALFHDFGFEAMFISRMDDRLRSELIRKGEMTFLWEPFSAHFGEEKQILLHTLTEDYLYPKGLRYDERANEDSPVTVNKRLSTYNLDVKCAKMYMFVNNVTKEHKGQRNALVLWGDDFAFQNAFAQFEAID